MHAKLAEFLANNNIPDYSNNPTAEWVQDLYIQLTSELFPFVQHVNRPDTNDLMNMVLYVRHGFGLIKVKLNATHLVQPTAADLAVNLNKIGEFLESRDRSLKGPMARECRQVFDESRALDDEAAALESRVNQLERNLAPRRPTYNDERRQADQQLAEIGDIHAECARFGQELEDLKTRVAAAKTEATELQHKINERKTAIAGLEQLVHKDSNTQVHARSRIDNLRLELGHVLGEQQRRKASANRLSAELAKLEQVALYANQLEDSVAQHAGAQSKLTVAEQQATELRLALHSTRRELERARGLRRDLEAQQTLLRDQHAEVAETRETVTVEQAAREQKLTEDMKLLGEQIAQSRSDSVELQHQLKSTVEKNRELSAMLADKPQLLAAEEGRLDRIVADFSRLSQRF